MSNLSTNNFDGLPLFQTVASRTCKFCFNTRLVLSPENTVERCPVILRGDVHEGENAEAVALRRSVELLAARQIWINAQAFDLARLLTNFGSENPCPRQEIFDTFYDESALSYGNQLRKFHALIEELRAVWLLPIGSRKCEPSGYWIITELEDFKEWVERVRAAPITQLSTIHKVARANFPVFAEQLELDFWEGIKAEES